MKMKIKIPALFLASLLALSAFAGCNSLPPAENPSNSVSAESSPLTEEEREHLRTVRTAVHEHLRVADTAAGGYRDLATIQGLETERKLRDEYPPGEYIVWLEPFRQEVACDPTRDEYHSPQVAELLEQGMFINEVRALLGRPHGTTFAILNGVGVRCNTYTAYTLDDGRVLLLRFIQASVKDYSQEELERRVPNFNERDWEVRLILEDTGIGWFKLQEVQILTLEEYLGTRYVSVGTPEEELPEEYKNGGGTIRPRSSDTTIH